MNASTRDLIRRIVALEGWAALPSRRVRAMVITELGIRYRIDDAGELWPDAEQLADKLGVDRQVVQEMARHCPPPVGNLHTLQ